MNNKIFYITKKEAEAVQSFAKDRNNVFFSEIDGAKILSEETYVREISRAFGFFDKLPMATFEWCNDYLCDLMWIKQENIVLLIYNFNVMSINAPETKQNIIADFEEIILPWWDGEVVGHMVGGVPRNFNVYLEVSDAEAGKEYEQ